MLRITALPRRDNDFTGERMRKKMDQGRSKSDLLRERAEKILSQKPEAVRKIPVKDMTRLIHELEVHQVELDMQNDELRKAQAEIELSRAKYVDLYDFAPVGYFTLTPTGRIEEVNLTGAKLLGVEKPNLVNRDFRSFIAPEFRKMFDSHRLEVVASDAVVKCELRLTRRASDPLNVSLESLSVRSGDGSASLIRSTMSDITERKKTEAALHESEERCRYLSSQLLVAQETERHRIAGELHDDIGHRLINMKQLIDPLLTCIRKEGLETDVKRFETFVSILDSLWAQVKKMQQDLRPSMLEDIGLLVTIGWLCREFGEAHSGIRIDKSLNIEEREIPTSLKLVIFRILQEALNNVAKHSKASLFRLSLRKVKEEIELIVSDNGEGFDVKEMPRHGLGLVSMRERAELSHGNFSIQSDRGKGTVLRVTWAL
jgi:PAS domain S-box-containing protein